MNRQFEGGIYPKNHGVEIGYQEEFLLVINDVILAMDDSRLAKKRTGGIGWLYNEKEANPGVCVKGRQLRLINNQ